jgi:hypothetical protein
MPHKKPMGRAANLGAYLHPAKPKGETTAPATKVPNTAPPQRGKKKK